MNQHKTDAFSVDKNQRQKTATKGHSKNRRIEQHNNQSTIQIKISKELNQMKNAEIQTSSEKTNNQY